MAEIKRYGVATLPKEFIGTNAERLALSTTDLPVGSTWWATDTKLGYIFDGTIWQGV